MQLIDALVKVERQRWWGHLTLKSWQQPSILQKRIAAGTATLLVKVKAHRRAPANKGADILVDRAISDPKVSKEWCQRTNQAVFRWKPRAVRQGKLLIKIIIRHLVIRGGNQYKEWQQRMRCQSMKRSLQVLGDKWAHSGDDIKSGVKVMTRRTAHTSNDMRHCTKAWWRSGTTLGLITEHSWNYACELG